MLKSDSRGQVIWGDTYSRSCRFVSLRIFQSLVIFMEGGFALIPFSWLSETLMITGVSPMICLVIADHTLLPAERWTSLTEWTRDGYVSVSVSANSGSRTLHTFPTDKIAYGFLELSWIIEFHAESDMLDRRRRHILQLYRHIKAQQVWPGNGTGCICSCFPYHGPMADSLLMSWLESWAGYGLRAMGHRSPR